MSFVRRNTVHIAMMLVFITAAVFGLYLWNAEALPIWLARTISYCS